jgi:hypothetical protein
MEQPILQQNEGEPEEVKIVDEKDFKDPTKIKQIYNWTLYCKVKIEEQANYIKQLEEKLKHCDLPKIKHQKSIERLLKLGNCAINNSEFEKLPIEAFYEVDEKGNRFFENAIIQGHIFLSQKIIQRVLNIDSHSTVYWLISKEDLQKMDWSYLYHYNNVGDSGVFMLLRLYETNGASSSEAFNILNNIQTRRPALIMNMCNSEGKSFLQIWNTIHKMKREAVNYYMCSIPSSDFNKI